MANEWQFSIMINKYEMQDSWKLLKIRAFVLL